MEEAFRKEGRKGLGLFGVCVLFMRSSLPFWDVAQIQVDSDGGKGVTQVCVQAREEGTMLFSGVVG